MLEKLKKSGNLPLIIVLTIILIIAIFLSIVKVQSHKETNGVSAMNDSSKQEDIEDKDLDILITEIVDGEVPNEEEPEQDQQEEQQPEKEENTNIKYFIRVNYGQNVVTIYTKDSKGNYTVPYKAMVCSTGSATPKSGTYAIPGSGTKLPRGTWGLMYGNVWAQYFTRIKGSILFHSVPYYTRNKNDLEYLEYDKLGTTASAGCIRLTVQDAKWIYDNCPAGTKVEFYTDSNPGPLGKPTAQKISNHVAVRGWDPTDPDKNNPWKTYNPNQVQQQEEDEDNTPSTNVTPNTPPAQQEPTIPENGTENEGKEPEEQNPEQNGDGSASVEPPVPGENEGTENQPQEPNEGENTGGETPNPNEGENPEAETPPTNEGENSGEQVTPSSEGVNSG